MIFGKLKLYAIISAIGAALMGVIYAMGMSRQQTKQVKKDHDDYVETRNDIEDSQSDAAKSDPSEWLRKRKSDRNL